MATFIISMSWTDQAIRKVHEAEKRAHNGKAMAKKFGVDYKHLYMTSGDSDLLAVVEAPNGDNVARFALALSARKCSDTHLQSLDGGRISQDGGRARTQVTERSRREPRSGTANTSHPSLAWT
jgi:uncharacterized protein with GYD domain